MKAIKSVNSFVGHLNGYVFTRHYIASNDRVTDELKTTWKEAVVT
jgi:hypothetical protein